MSLVSISLIVLSVLFVAAVVETQTERRPADGGPVPGQFFPPHLGPGGPSEQGGNNGVEERKEGFRAKRPRAAARRESVNRRKSSEESDESDEKRPRNLSRSPNGSRSSQSSEEKRRGSRRKQRRRKSKNGRRSGRKRGRKGPGPKGGRRPRPPKRGFYGKGRKGYNRFMRDQLRKADEDDKCGCISPPNSTKCIGYDHEYQAALLGEAMINFPDLTLQNSPMIAHKPKKRLQCDDDDDECETCKEELAEILQQKGSFSHWDPDWDEEKNLTRSQRQAARKERKERNTKCGRHNFKTQITSSATTTTAAPTAKAVYTTEQRKIINSLKKEGEKWNSEQDVKRRKRQTQEEIGTSANIHCLKPGEEEKQGASELVMCGMCWTWRDLGEEYFPSLINELECDSTYPSCISGLGSCQQRFKALNVLKKVNGEWQEQQISSRTCCDCVVHRGTTMEALIRGD